jgi:hypothetical protein
VAELVVSVEVGAPADKVWAQLTDWPSHGEWMLLTTVEPTTRETQGVGAGIVGITGIGPLAFRDTMSITSWQPPPSDPARCAVAHTGNLIRGAGAFEVEYLAAGRSRVVWSEWVQLPLGLLGELGWIAVRPLAALFLRISLRRLAKRIEAGA